jgi:succinoglycan biosynthesis protein ExoV
MKTYLKWSKNNFGDELNDIIFPRLGYTTCIEFNKKNLLDLNTNCVLGLGTLLNKKIKSKITVAGSGSDGISRPSQDLNYIFVRGKLTATHLDLSSKFGIGDPAYYLKTDIQKLNCNKKTRKVGIVPHWSSIGAINNSNIISPFLPVNQFIQEVSQCEYILAEAMHGAICADILRIPFAPIKIKNNVNEFKWHDWASCMNFDIKFGTISNHSFILSEDKILDKVVCNVTEHLETLKFN